MKSLLLIRHAKSSWDMDVDDFDRLLNHRGEKDAPAMAERLILKNIEIDTLISSPAKRAFATAGYFAKAYNIADEKIIQIPSLYEPTAGAFLNALQNLNDANKTVAIFSHNPGITHFVNSLTNAQIDDMPTCAIFAIHLDIKHWQEFTGGKKEFWFFDYPKAL